MDDRQAVPIVVPDLGCDSPARLVQWLVDGGSGVQSGDRIAEILVDGVLFHLPSPAEGVLASERVGAGTAVEIGETIGSIHASMLRR